MEDWAGLAVILVVATLAVPVLLVVALVSIASLKRRVARLEARVATLATERRAAPVTASRPEPVVRDLSTHPARPRAEPPPRPGTAISTHDRPAVPSPVAPAPRQPAAARVDRATWTAVTGPSSTARATAWLKRWFTEGNVPVKVGMLVLLAGVAALLRYASEQGWLRLPIQFRLAGVAFAALVALVFAWRQRARRRTFALAVQGGAVGVLLLVVFAAFRRYDLIGGAPAFSLSVVLVAGLAVLAVVQDSRTLAILGVLAGFMAPLWLSDGTGSHVVLFAYYALLNVGILAMAWVRPWRVLNLLGFVFTWGIGVAWGVLAYTPDKFASTEPFLWLFFGFYLALPLLYARRAPEPGITRISGSVLFGTPLIAFTLQAGLLHGQRLPLALSALGVAALYAALAWGVIRRPRCNLLGQGYVVLALGFATLAVPLALSASTTASVFAVEGAGLVWLGWAQRRRWPRWTGIGLQVLAGLALRFSAWDPAAVPGVPVFNAFCMGALLVAVAGFATAWLYRRAGEAGVATAAYVWALAWWLGNAVTEIQQFVPHASRWYAMLVLLGATGWLAAEAQRHAPARALPLTTLGCVVLAFPLAIIQSLDYGQPFAGWGAPAWSLFAVFGLRALWCLRRDENPVAAAIQLAWWWLWPSVLSLQAWHLGQRFGLADGWVGMLLALPWLVMAAVGMYRWRWLAAPRGPGFERYRPLRLAVLCVVLGGWWLIELLYPGSSSPLPWVAVLNPLDLAQVAALVLAALWWRKAALLQAEARAWLVPMLLAGLLLVTAITLRAVHHWGGVPWDAALLGTGTAQTSLTVVWSLLGVAAWIRGSQGGRWGLWLVGAALMGVVLAKLLLVDRTHLGSLFGIGGFIAYGLLCTVIGWLAPAPPRRPAAQPEKVASA